MTALQKLDELETLVDEVARGKRTLKKSVKDFMDEETYSNFKMIPADARKEVKATIQGLINDKLRKIVVDQLKSVLTAQAAAGKEEGQLTEALEMQEIMFLFPSLVPAYQRLQGEFKDSFDQWVVEHLPKTLNSIAATAVAGKVAEQTGDTTDVEQKKQNLIQNLKDMKEPIDLPLGTVEPEEGLEGPEKADHFRQTFETKARQALIQFFNDFESKHGVTRQEANFDYNGEQGKSHTWLAFSWAQAEGAVQAADIVLNSLDEIDVSQEDGYKKLYERLDEGLKEAASQEEDVPQKLGIMAGYLHVKQIVAYYFGDDYMGDATEQGKQELQAKIEGKTNKSVEDPPTSGMGNGSSTEVVPDPTETPSEEGGEPEVEPDHVESPSDNVLGTLRTFVADKQYDEAMDLMVSKGIVFKTSKKMFDKLNRRSKFYTMRYIIKQLQKFVDEHTEQLQEVENTLTPQELGLPEGFKLKLGTLRNIIKNGIKTFYDKQVEKDAKKTGGATELVTPPSEPEAPVEPEAQIPEDINFQTDKNGVTYIPTTVARKTGEGNLWLAFMQKPEGLRQRRISQNMVGKVQPEDVNNESKASSIDQWVENYKDKIDWDQVQSGDTEAAPEETPVDQKEPIRTKIRSALQAGGFEPQPTPEVPAEPEAPEEEPAPEVPAEPEAPPVSDEVIKNAFNEIRDAATGKSTKTRWRNKIREAGSEDEVNEIMNQFRSKFGGEETGQKEPEADVDPEVTPEEEPAPEEEPDLNEPPTDIEQPEPDISNVGDEDTSDEEPSAEEIPTDQEEQTTEEEPEANPPAFEAEGIRGKLEIRENDDGTYHLKIINNRTGEVSKEGKIQNIENLPDTVRRLNDMMFLRSTELERVNQFARPDLFENIHDKIMKEFEGDSLGQSNPNETNPSNPNDEFKQGDDQTNQDPENSDQAKKAAKDSIEAQKRALKIKQQADRKQNMAQLDVLKAKSQAIGE